MIEVSFRYEEDLWIEVAKYLDGRDLVQLAVTNRWFCRLILEESVWKYACLRDLHVPSPHHVSFNWLQLYASAFDGSHSHCFRQKEKHIDWMRIGAFFFETPWAVLTEKLALPSKLTELSENHERDIQLSGTCILTDIRTGIWIADLQLVRCPVCNLHTCEGTMQILDVRHLELFLEEGFRNGSWEFDELGSHRIEKPSKSAAGGVFDYSHVYSSCTAEVFIGKAKNVLTLHILTSTSVSYNSYLKSRRRQSLVSQEADTELFCQEDSDLFFESKEEAATISLFKKLIKKVFIPSLSTGEICSLSGSEDLS
ncbi:putative F-box protein [Platanthera zijinensis]|uniref:F-box protein n=1 Tax=Platanthera zijinensis TaxID=2320716 RepID=A0AAP0G424_9ASPA